MTCWHQLNPETGNAKCNVNVKLNTPNVLIIEAKDVHTQPDVDRVCHNCFSAAYAVKRNAVIQGRIANRYHGVPRTRCPKCPSGRLSYNNTTKVYRCPDCFRNFVRNAQDELVVKSGSRTP
jgi:hypothetical protein